MPGRPPPLSARSRRTNNYLSSACLLAFLLLPTQGLLAQSTPNWSDWDALLQQYVNDGFVDYRGLRQDSRFPSVVKAIEQADSGAMSNPQKLAYYINAYNILAIQGILIAKSPAGALGRIRYFYRDKYLVAGEKLTLSALENDYIRTLGEPRIHFAIVCASKSCPPLRSQAYTADDLVLQVAQVDGPTVQTEFPAHEKTVPRQQPTPHGLGVQIAVEDSLKDQGVVGVDVVGQLFLVAHCPGIGLFDCFDY
jgi:hypothetical protein